MVSFDYSNFDIDNYSFFSSREIVVGKNVNENKFVVCKFYLTVHRFHARSKVQLAPPTVNICGKA